MPRSISTRVLIAFGTVLAAAALLLTAGLLVAHQIRDKNQGVARLSALLRAQGLEDHRQQELRLAIGDVTRLAEGGSEVPPARWAQVAGQVAALTHESRRAAADAAGLAPSLRSAAATRAAAGDRFRATSLDLLATARREPHGIKARMGPFLAALKALESAQTEMRLVLTRDIDETIARNARAMYRNILRVLVGGVLTVLALTATLEWLRRQLISPIVAIADRLRQFNRDDEATAHVPGLHREDELGDLARGLFEYRQAVEQRRSAERQADHLAHHDALTGLPNRLRFENRLAELQTQAQGTGETLAVFAIDVDDFKAINDRLGHAGGDAALRRTAQLLAGCAGSDDLVARLGGDEFAIVQRAPGQPLAAEMLVDRILNACAATAVDQTAIRLSIGVALSGSEQDVEELHTRADLAMYRAKTDGRGAARFFDAALQEEVGLSRRLARDLGAAIDRGEFHLAYQPIAEAETLRVIGHEALLRWTHAELGEIAPDRFIPLAESGGMIDRIGMWAAREAMAQAASWDGDRFLALNLSPIQLRSPGFAQALIALADASGLPLHRLEFEVTESATLLGTRRDAVIPALRSLQRAGARIVMDDFGTGYASLGNLRDFRFDKLKIDRSFVAAMDEDPASISIVRAILALGGSLAIPVVAEGVATETQLAMLRRWGCRQVQGYRIGHPQPSAAALVC